MAKRTDANQAALMADLRRLGATVLDLHTLGKGAPDLLVAWGGSNVLVEVKRPGESLNELQQQWHATWLGPVIIATSAEDVLTKLRHPIMTYGEPDY